MGYIRIDGSVPSSERAQLVRKFQTDPAIRVAVLSIQAAGQVPARPSGPPSIICLCLSVIHFSISIPAGLSIFQFYISVSVCLYVCKCMYSWVSVSLSVCRSIVSLFVCFSLCLLSVCLFFPQFLSDLSVSLALFLCLSSHIIHCSISVSSYMSVCLSVCTAYTVSDPYF